MWRRRGPLLIALMATGLVLSVPPSRGQEPRPNVVVILTDDQRWDTIWAMPTVQAQLVDKGVSFSQAFASNPWCCPSRASILTGTYSHTNGVWRNTSPYGGFASFKDSSTVATWLDAAGYRTALIGKYLNGYEGKSYIPPGWDRWVAFKKKPYAYYGYTLNVDGGAITYGTKARDYSTDVLRDYATSFINSTPSSEPLFLFFAPNAPHPVINGAPKPAPRHATAFGGLAPWRPPSWNEPDVSDKPAHIQALTTKDIDLFRKKQYRTLLAVDDAVRSILGALSATGRLANTMIVFASDNGYFWAEHRLVEKQAPYEESIRIPLVIRSDAISTGRRTDTHMVANVDLAPTIAAAAGVAAPGSEGRSLVEHLGSDTPLGWRDDLLLEHLHGPSLDVIPTYCALRTEDKMYATYDTGERELYDLRADPYQLTNVAGEPEQAATVSALDARLRTLCDPPPPGFSFPPAPSPMVHPLVTPE